MVNAEDAKAFGVEKMELDEIWPLADYITVHTPLIPQTKSKSGLLVSDVMSSCCDYQCFQILSVIRRSISARRVSA